MFVNTMPRYEILSADSVEVLERGWRRIVSEIGIQFAKPEAVELFAKAGQQVDGDVVKLDPDFVLEQVAKAPREFDVQARNPANSVPIRGDRMLDAQFEYCAAGQPVVLTPFLLMGAMSPVTIPAALTQQLAEALSGIVLAQLIRPGTPVIFGSFLSNIDMQSGSPSFGTPESALGLLCTGQLARHYGLPFRTGGGPNSSQTADAQSAYEALMTLLPTFLAGTNFVMHAAGWLEGGLVSCYEKFIIDIELLRELRVEVTPLEITEESLAFGAHTEVGHGGHFLGAEHTMERFRECFYRPMLSSTANFERWLKLGGKDTAARAGEIWRKKLESFEAPPLDDAIRAELDDFVTRRRRELGD